MVGKCEAVGKVGREGRESCRELQWRVQVAREGSPALAGKPPQLLGFFIWSKVDHLF